MTREYRPLDGLIVVDLCQFLSGPYASLRMQDLGARVIKVERPGVGDLTRRLYLSDTVIDGDSTMFHAINRGKESLALDLKDPADLNALKQLVAQADVVLQNFRPGVIERLGLSYEAARELRPDIVYGSVSGYGPEGPWSRFPGQDLLAQARSGVMWLNGSAGDGPVPFGLAVADMMAGAALAHGVLAALVGRGLHGRGAHVETSLLEALLDLQFEVLATHFNDGGRPPERARVRSAHAGLAAPYGVYPTQDGHIAIAMTPLDRLCALLDLDSLRSYADDPATWFAERDRIKSLIADRLLTHTTGHWLGLLQPHDIWVAPVMHWRELFSDPVFTGLEMIQTLKNDHGAALRLLRSPLRIDGCRSSSARAAPPVGGDTSRIRAEFGI